MLPSQPLSRGPLILATHTERDFFREEVWGKTLEQCLGARHITWPAITNTRSVAVSLWKDKSPSPQLTVSFRGELKKTRPQEMAQKRMFHLQRESEDQVARVRKTGTDVSSPLVVSEPYPQKAQKEDTLFLNVEPLEQAEDVPPSDAKKGVKALFSKNTRKPTTYRTLEIKFASENGWSNVLFLFFAGISKSNKSTD